MKRQILCLIITFSILTVLVSFKPVLAAPFYQGKVVKIIVGSDVGGGNDRMARLVAKHMPKFIPGSPVFIVENMPGAGSVVAANYIYNNAAADGLIIGAVQRGIIYSQLTKAQGVRFDLRKYCWIGSPSVEGTVLCVRSDHPSKTYDDLRKRTETDPLFIAHTGAGGVDTAFIQLLQDYTGLKVKLVAYTSQSLVNLALMRKEVDAKAGTYSSFKPNIEAGEHRPLLRGRVSEKGIENLPIDEDVATDKKGKTLMAMRSAPDFVGRIYITPPGTPADIMKILTDAFAKAVNSAEMQEEAKKLSMDLTYVPPEQCMKVLDEFFDQPEDIIKEFGKIMRLE